MDKRDFPLTEKQSTTVDLVNQGNSLFLTGGGGVGKSVVVRELITKNTVLLAPTGIAAVNIGGATCHSVFKLPLGTVVQQDFINTPSKITKLFGKGKNIDRIIIDEIGMVRADMLDLMDHRLKQARQSGEPFGGIQVVFVGDFFQLNPIVSKEEKRIFEEKYDTPYAFGSLAWKNLNPVTVELDQVMRQTDERQIKILNSIRKKDDNFSLAVQRINEMSVEDEIEEAITLCTLRKTASAMNQYRYRQEQGKEQIYRATVEGDFKKGDFPTEEILKLKEGCRVVFCANDHESFQFQNGEQGTVTEVNYNSVRVEKDDGNSVLVTQHEWGKQDYVDNGPEGLSRKEVGKFYQIPLMLGYGITIHKAQGMTLPAYNLDMGWGAFSHGQTYVALSRAKDLEKIHLKSPLKKKDIIVDKEVQDFYRSIES